MTAPDVRTAVAGAPGGPGGTPIGVLPGDPGPDGASVERLVAAALDEDLGVTPGRDVTTQATVPPDEVGTARLMARADGVLAGVVVVTAVLAQVADRLALPTPTVTVHLPDGSALHRGDVVAELTGPVQALLVAERTLLNLVSRASGVATHTRRFADVLAGTGARVLDTRKTTPGLRALEKYAVRCGGGTNKRMGLYDVAMVKDNHVVAAGGVAAAVRAVRDRFPGVAIQVEADTLDQAMEALDAGADFLLLDNMPVPVLTDVVAAVRAREPQTGRVELEATGNLTLDTAAAVASTGVDYLSVGALTHSSPILDLALDLDAPALVAASGSSSRPTPLAAAPVPSDLTPSALTPSAPTPSEPTPSDLRPSEPTPSDPTLSDLTPSDLEAFVAANPMGVLATVGASGEPEAALVGVVALADGTLLVDALSTSRKVQNIRRAPRVAVVVGLGDVTFQVEGVARIADGPERATLAAAYEAGSPGSRAFDPDLAIIAVVPGWVRRYDATQRPAGVTEAQW